MPSQDDRSAKNTSKDPADPSVQSQSTPSKSYMQPIDEKVANSLGYKPVSKGNQDIVKAIKEYEEQALRWMDSVGTLSPHVADVDQRWLAMARTHLQLAAMCSIRAILKPDRVRLPGDPDYGAR